MNKQVNHNMILAAQKVLQTVGGTNPEATKVAHEQALAELKAALGPFIKAARKAAKVENSAAGAPQ